MPTSRPAEGQAVHLYLAVGESDLTGLASDDGLLNAEERARATGFVLPADRALYRAAHVLLRRALSCHAQVDPADWRFSPGPYGRPLIAAADCPAGAGLHFSLAHTRGLVCCAVTTELAVGIDAEYDRPLSDSLDLARQFFAPDESAALAALPPADRSKRFYALWTLKECFVKAIGLGLSAGLDCCAFRLAAGTPGSIAPTLDLALGPVHRGTADKWRFVLLRSRVGHTLAAGVYAETGGRFCIHPIPPLGGIPPLALTACSAGAQVELDSLASAPGTGIGDNSMCP
jgi:4'-phosphopantetheinyl transferase